MDSPVFSGVENIAGRGIGLLAAATAIKGGGLGNYMMARARMLGDPNFRSTLVDSPFTSGFFGLGGGPAPAGPGGASSGGVAQPGDGAPAADSAAIAAPGDVRYLPTGGHWYPAVSPLDYASQAKAETDRANMIGLTSADPTIRAQSKLAIGVPLSGAEITGPDGRGGIVGAGRQIVGAAGPGSQVRYKTGFGDITVGSPYIAGNYLDPSAAAIVAARTGKIPVPSPGGGTEFVAPDRLGEGEFTDPAAAAAARKPNERTVPTGRTAATVNGVLPILRNEQIPPTGVTPLENRGAVGPPRPAAPTPVRPAAPATPPAPAPAPAAPAAPAEQPAAPTPPAAAAAPPPPPPPPPPPHEVVRQNPDGSFSPIKPPAPAAPARRPPAPRAEATPAEAPPLLAAAAPPSSGLFQFPWNAPAAAAAPAPVMVARAEPPPYELVPGAELGGVASGAPPAPAEQRGAPPPPTPPGPASVVPFAQAAPGQPAAGTGATPAGLPPGSLEFTETRPLPADVGGSVTVTGKTPAALDYERRQAEIQKDVERRFGKIPEAKDLQSAYMIRSPQNALLSEYTPDERAAYLGYLQPSINQFWLANDPRYQHFLALNDEIRSAMIAAGASKDALDALPTGTERSPAEYEQKLRSAVDTADRMITGQSALANMHTADLTAPEKQQRLLQYMSTPNAVHFGPYPWDDKTGEPLPTQSTPPSAPPTSTTSPYPVDRLYLVQPPPSR